MIAFNKLVILFLLVVGLSSYAFSQSSTDSCEWTIPKTADTETKYGTDYRFKIQCTCALKNYQLSIFNAWGEVIFESQEIKDYWYSENTQNGTYYWLITAEYKKGGKYTETGPIEVNN